MRSETLKKGSFLLGVALLTPETLAAAPKSIPEFFEPEPSYEIVFTGDAFPFSFYSNRAIPQTGERFPVSDYFIPELSNLLYDIDRISVEENPDGQTLTVSDAGSEEGRVLDYQGDLPGDRQNLLIFTAAEPISFESEEVAPGCRRYVGTFDRLAFRAPAQLLYYRREVSVFFLPVDGKPDACKPYLKDLGTQIRDGTLEDFGAFYGAAYANGGLDLQNIENLKEVDVGFVFTPRN